MKKQNDSVVVELLKKIKEFDEWCIQHGFSRNHVLEFTVESDSYRTELSVGITDFNDDLDEL